MKVFVKLLPIYNDLIEEGFLTFFQTTDFIRVVNNLGLETEWVIAQEELAENKAATKQDSFWDFVDAKDDYKDLLIILLNNMFKRNGNFADTISEFVIEFLKFTPEYVSMVKIQNELQTLGISDLHKKALSQAVTRHENNLGKVASNFKAFLIQIAVGGTWDEVKYHKLRDKIMKMPDLRPRVPEIIKASPTIADFWAMIKTVGGYSDRRIYLNKEFSGLIDHLNTISNFPIEVSVVISEDHINEVWKKALERLKSDPEAAITSARTLIETVCKHILDKQNETYDDGLELPKLYKLAATNLNLSPEQHTENAFKQILTGASSIVAGMGSLRNKLSDAHGKRITTVKPSARHAALTVNVAGAMCIFLLQTYQAQKDKLSNKK